MHPWYSYDLRLSLSWPVIVLIINSVAFTNQTYSSLILRCIPILASTILYKNSSPSAFWCKTFSDGIPPRPPPRQRPHRVNSYDIDIFPDRDIRGITPLLLQTTLKSPTRTWWLVCFVFSCGSISNPKDLQRRYTDIEMSSSSSSP